MKIVLRTAYIVLALAAAVPVRADVRPLPTAHCPLTTVPTLAPPPPEYLYCWLLEEGGQLFVTYTIAASEIEARPCYRTWSIWSGDWETWQDWRWKLAYRTSIEDLLQAARSGTRAVREVEWPR